MAGALDRHLEIRGRIAEHGRAVLGVGDIALVVEGKVHEAAKRDVFGGRAGALIEEAAGAAVVAVGRRQIVRSEEHTSELQSLMRISYAVFCLKKKKNKKQDKNNTSEINSTKKNVATHNISTTKNNHEHSTQKR